MSSPELKEICDELNKEYPEEVTKADLVKIIKS